MKNWKDFIVTPDTSTQELGELLVAKFGSWVGTPSEELLEDGWTVIDHMTDDGHNREILESLPEELWEAAWEYFNNKMAV